jgi:hypothetical protein
MKRAIDRCHLASGVVRLVDDRDVAAVLVGHGPIRHSAYHRTADREPEPASRAGGDRCRSTVGDVALVSEGAAGKLGPCGASH